MKWSVGKKLYAGFGVIILIMAVLGSLSVYEMKIINDKSTEIKDNWLPSTRVLLEINASTERLVKQELKHIVSTDQTEMNDYENRMNETIQGIESSLQEYEELISSDDEKQAFQQFSIEWEKYITVHNSIVEASSKNDNEQAAIKVKESESIFNNLRDALDVLVKLNVEGAKKASDSGDKTYASASIIIITFIVVALVSGIAIAYFLTRAISKPLIDITNKLQLVADGDLRVEPIVVKSKDEIASLADSFNTMVHSIRDILQQLMENSTNLAASAEEISASTEEIATGSQQQASDATGATEMVKEMARAVHDVAKNAEEAARSAEDTVKAATDGGDVIQGTLKGMEDISLKITDLSNKSVQIGNIVEVIDDIAEQTNLLALNAAIEAARAGEAGKGFAVVAEEVRKLAERSGKATKEITLLVRSIQDNTTASVEAVAVGNEKTTNAGKAFEKIISLVQESANKVTDIAAASEEQSAQSQEVLIGVENIAAVSEQTAASVQETAATATDLAKMAEILNQLAMKFKI